MAGEYAEAGGKPCTKLVRSLVNSLSKGLQKLLHKALHQALHKAFTSLAYSPAVPGTRRPLRATAAKGWAVHSDADLTPEKTKLLLEGEGRKGFYIFSQPARL